MSDRCSVLECCEVLIVLYVAEKHNERRSLSSILQRKGGVSFAAPYVEKTRNSIILRMTNVTDEAGYCTCA